MYDDRDFWPPSPWDDDPFGARTRPRLMTLVLVDGRLVDAWTEQVEGTRWEPIAREFDEQRTPPPPPAPPIPAHERMTSWLRGLVGGPDQLADLATTPLAPLAWPELETLALGQRHRLEGIRAALDRVIGLDEELEIAVGNAVSLVQEADPTFLGTFVSAQQAAGGLVWAVGKANGRLSPAGPLRHKEIAGDLGLGSQSLTGFGRRVATLLAGAPGLLASRPSVYGVPDLLALGTPLLLTSGTRRLLVRLRDQAIRAAEAAA